MRCLAAWTLPCNHGRPPVRQCHNRATNHDATHMVVPVFVLDNVEMHYGDPITTAPAASSLT
eukprot:7463346-Pyramimonas_sp.AAC.4